MGERINTAPSGVRRRRRSPVVLIVVVVLAVILGLGYVFAPQLFGPGPPAPIPEGGAPAGTASGMTDEAVEARPASGGEGATRKELMASDGLPQESPNPTDRRGSGVALPGSGGASR